MILKIYNLLKNNNAIRNNIKLSHEMAKYQLTSKITTHVNPVVDTIYRLIYAGYMVISLLLCTPFEKKIQKTNHPTVLLYEIIYFYSYFFTFYIVSLLISI